MLNYFKMLARYNHWANARLYEACRQLPAKAYLKDRKAFFGSIHGTLNHILIRDRLWLARFKCIDSAITATTKILYDDFTSLWQARQKEDDNIIVFIDELNPEKLQMNIAFKTLAEQEHTMPSMWIFAHLFNHHTHHRGQVHNMLAQAGIKPPVIDLYYFLNE